MPLVAHTELPTFSYLQARGHDVLSADRAARQDIRELHIGFLNMMPDAALQATERQFIRLVGGCNRIAQFYVYPFSLPELERGEEAQDYISRYYSRFEDLQAEGLDALIVTGANVANPRLPEEAFWNPLIEVAEWANENVTSILCSCLATHALLKHHHDIDRCPLPQKRWGVYEHRVCSDSHPLLREINTRFDAPHSRHNEITRRQLEDAGLRVLVEDIDGGVHLAVSPDQFRVVYFQGHPEYDVISLFKEYKRELVRHASGERSAPPPHPDNYFSPDVLGTVAEYAEQMGRDPDSDARGLERHIVANLDNTWGDTAKAIMSNWLGLVYQLTNLDRREQFMSGVDRNDPLGSVSHE